MGMISKWKETIDAAVTRYFGTSAYKVGLGLIFASLGLYGLMISLPFMDIPFDHKVGVASVAFVLSEVTFWTGGLLAGKEIFARYGKLPDIEKLFKKLERNI